MSRWPVAGPSEYWLTDVWGIIDEAPCINSFDSGLRWIFQLRPSVTSHSQGEAVSVYKNCTMLRKKSDRLSCFLVSFNFSFVADYAVWLIRIQYWFWDYESCWCYRLVQNVVHLNINQLDALNFIMSLFHASTCFEHMCSSSGGQNCTIQPLVSLHL